MSLQNVYIQVHNLGAMEQYENDDFALNGILSHLKYL